MSVITNQGEFILRRALKDNYCYWSPQKRHSSMLPYNMLWKRRYVGRQKDDITAILPFL